MCLGIPGKLVEIIGDDPIFRMGKIDFSGVVREASLAAIPEACVGEYVIVHAGLAISKLDEDEAEEVFAYLDELAKIQEETPPPQSPNPNPHPPGHAFHK